MGCPHSSSFRRPFLLGNQGILPYLLRLPFNLQIPAILGCKPPLSSWLSTGENFYFFLASFRCLMRLRLSSKTERSRERTARRHDDDGGRRCPHPLLHVLAQPKSIGTMKLAIASLLAGSAAAFTSSPAPKSSVALHESKVCFTPVLLVE